MLFLFIKERLTVRSLVPGFTYFKDGLSKLKRIHNNAQWFWNKFIIISFDLDTPCPPHLISNAVDGPVQIRSVFYLSHYNYYAFVTNLINSGKMKKISNSYLISIINEIYMIKRIIQSLYYKISLLTLLNITLLVILTLLTL